MEGEVGTTLSNWIRTKSKKEINTDYELKEAFFQAALKFKLVKSRIFRAAFYFNESLYDEMKRLSLAFGIGIIQLKSNPYEVNYYFRQAIKN